MYKLYLYFSIHWPPTAEPTPLQYFPLTNVWKVFGIKIEHLPAINKMQRGRLLRRRHLSKCAHPPEALLVQKPPTRTPSEYERTHLGFKSLPAFPSLRISSSFGFKAVNRFSLLALGRGTYTVLLIALERPLFFIEEVVPHFHHYKMRPWIHDRIPMKKLLNITVTK